MLTPLSLKLALPALLAGALLGYGVGRARSAAPGNAAARAASMATTASPGALSPDGTPLEARQLKTVLSHSTEREALLWLRRHSGSFASGDYKAAAMDVMTAGAGRYERLLGEVLENWARIAPLEALDYLRSLPPGVQRNVFSHVAIGWAEADPDGLLAWYTEQETQEPTERWAVIGAVAAKRPDAVFALIQKLPSEGGNSPYSSFLGSLATEEPARALEFFTRLPEAEQVEAIGGLLYGWDTANPDAALAWLAGLPKGPLREKGYITAVAMLANVSPREAAELAIRELSSSEAAMSASYSVVWQWASNDPGEAERFFAEQPDSPFKKKAMEMIAQEMATHDPLDYLDRCVERQSFGGEGDGRWLSHAASTLFTRDPAAFEKWFSANRSDVPADQMANLLWGPSRENPELAARLLALLPEGRSVDSAYQSLGSNWAEKDMEGARRFLQTLPAGPARNRFQTALIATTAIRDLPAALKEAEQITDPNQQRSLLRNILSRNKDFDTIASWVQSRPAGKDTSNLYEALVSRWANDDVKAAGSWVATLPEGTLREATIRSYATQIAGNHPQTAIEWAEKIRDGKQREQTLNNIASSWSSVDKEAAAKWVATSSLPEAIKQQYLKD